MPPGLHAVLSASGAKRWLSCPPSARLEEKLRERIGLEDKGSPYAREGTKAHELAELKLRRELGEINNYNFTERVKQLGDIPKDMDEATDFYCAVVFERLFEARRTCPDAKIILETRLDFSNWVPHGFGTGDCIIVSDQILDVIDYKHGVGVPVDAVDNPQTRLYMLGAINLLGCLYDFEKVRGTIIQPRLDSITEETMTRENLLDWANTEVVEGAKLAWEGKGEFLPGDHCRFCAAKAVCSARAAAALKIFDTGLDTPALLPDEQIPDILAFAAIAKSWIRDLEDYAQSQAIRGQRFAGYKLVRGRSVRSWKNAEEVADNLLRAGYKREDIFKHELRSVADIEKQLGKKSFRTFAEAYVFKPEGALTLVPDSDKRQAVNPADADFADMIND